MNGSTRRSAAERFVSVVDTMPSTRGSVTVTVQTPENDTLWFSKTIEVQVSSIEAVPRHAKIDCTPSNTARKAHSKRLKLRWARFFTLAGLNWNLSSTPGFDLKVTIPCRNGDCNGSHTLMVRICRKTCEALVQEHGEFYDVDLMYNEPHPALFGDGPDNTCWQMAHGAGGGQYTVSYWVGNANELWEQAAND
jgi:hypothetical protein